MSWLLPSWARRRGVDSSPISSTVSSSRSNEDLLIIRLLQSEQDDDDHDPLTNDTTSRDAAGDEEEGAAGGLPRRGGGAVGEEEEAAALLSTFRALTDSITTHRHRHQRGASAEDIAGYASRALHRTVSREEVEQLLGPPPSRTGTLRDKTGMITTTTAANLPFIGQTRHHSSQEDSSQEDSSEDDSSSSYYSADDFRRVLSSKIEKARASFDPTLPLALLTFNDVSCSYHQAGDTSSGNKKKKSKVVTVLKGVSGLVAPGWMVAIMGPSGAGKSTLLDIIAMRKSVGSITGEVLVNGVVRDSSFHQVSSYVAQEDTFLPTLSVRQTLRYYLDLRLGPGVLSRAGKDRRIKRLLREVGLANKDKAMVGGPLAGGLSIRGLSGGEKRRLSICCGTVANPSLLFLDEPTSGLDAMSALLVMEVMKKHAKRGMGVVCTIHQPRPSIWKMFDKLMLLSEGRLVYFSDTAHVTSWFCGTLGYPPPTDASQSDFVLDLVNVSFEKQGTGMILAGHQQPPQHGAGGAGDDEDDDDDVLDLSTFYGSGVIRRASMESSVMSEAPKGNTMTTVVVSGAGGMDDSNSMTGRGGGAARRTTMTTVSELDEAAARFQASPLMLELRALEVLYVFHLTALGVYGQHGDQQQKKKRGGSPIAAACSWLATGWYHFRLLLWRTFINYVRNPGNVLARVFVNALTAALHGLAFYQLDPTDAPNRLGSLFFGCMAMSLLPYASMSLFVYDRQFFSKDSAAGLYGVLPYFLSSVVLEALLLASTGLLYATITYSMVGQVVQQGGAGGSFGTLVAIYVVHSLVSSQFVQLMAILAPNQDVGFVLGAGYTSASMLVCGFLVTYPNLGSGLVWMQWIAFMKFSFQALAINEFKGTPLESQLIAGALDLERPRTVADDLACLGGFGIAFAVMAVLGLRFLHREKR